ncbi:MAG: hypothetical protein WC683_03100 [bacterium]
MRTQIDIFTRPYCEHCEKAKAQIMASDPASHGVTVNVHDAGEDSAIKQVPLIIIGDEPQIDGYYASAIEQALSNLYASLSPEVPDEETPPDETESEIVITQPPVIQASVASSPRAAVVVIAAILGFLAYRAMTAR